MSALLVSIYPIPRSVCWPSSEEKSNSAAESLNNENDVEIEVEELKDPIVEESKVENKKEEIVKPTEEKPIPKENSKISSPQQIIEKEDNEEEKIESKPERKASNEGLVDIEFEIEIPKQEKKLEEKPKKKKTPQPPKDPPPNQITLDL